MIKRILPILLLLAACDGADPTTGNPSLDFRSEPQDGARAVLTPRFEPGTGAVKVSGTFTAPCSAQEISGDLAVRGTTLLLTVSLVPHEPCFHVISYLGYEATVSGLAPGVHRVRVVYDYSAGGGQALEAGEATLRVH